MQPYGCMDFTQAAIRLHVKRPVGGSGPTSPGPVGEFRCVPVKSRVSTVRPIRYRAASTSSAELTFSPGPGSTAIQATIPSSRIAA
jgi:hypothetical protein